MAKNRWGLFVGGALVSAAIAGGWSVYSRRAIERIPTAEGLDDPAIAQAYGRVAAMPQMALMRRLVAQRATALCAVGEAADIGCGTGLLATELARQAPDLHITGVDLAAEMLAQAQEHAAQMDMAGRVTFRLGNGNRLPFEDRSLDLAVSTLSLHHWADPVGVFNEIARRAAARRRVPDRRSAPRHAAALLPAGVVRDEGRCAADAPSHRRAARQPQRRLRPVRSGPAGASLAPDGLAHDDGAVVADRGRQDDRGVAEMVWPG